MKLKLHVMPELYKTIARQYIDFWSICNVLQSDTNMF